MLNSIEIHNFQSLKQLNLDLGNFTVVVGESSSGKSALVRALETLSSNIKGSSFVTNGEKVAIISAKSEDFKITFKKGDGNSSYSLCSLKTAEEKDFTKLASAVPDAISHKLGIDPLQEGHSINFAGQHDSPFLLKDSGASVARILGELTNVSKLFEAVREANRRRTSSNSVLKVRQEDLKNLKTGIAEAENLKTQKYKIEQLKSLNAQINNLSLQIKELYQIVGELQYFDSLLSAVVDHIPDFNTLQNSYNTLCLYKELLLEFNYLNVIVKNSNVQIVNSSDNLHILEIELHKILEEAGECPLCGQEVVPHD